MPTGERERVEVSAKDIRGNSALHYAAANGLKRCVEYLVAHGADLFNENADGLTACDLAVRDNHHDIALFLESRMVFAKSTTTSSGESTELRSSGDSGSFEMAEDEGLKTNNGLLRSQDLQEAKEQLIGEMADTLSLTKHSAESLLRHHDWSRETVLKALEGPPVVGPEDKPAAPKPALAGRPMQTLAQPKIYSENSFIVDEELAEDECLCEICCDLIQASTVGLSENQEEPGMNCRHKVCFRCWKLHLTAQLQQQENLISQKVHNLVLDLRCIMIHIQNTATFLTS